jgi:hypothetical protein
LVFWNLSIIIQIIIKRIRIFTTKKVSTQSDTSEGANLWRKSQDPNSQSTIQALKYELKIDFFKKSLKMVYWIFSLSTIFLLIFSLFSLLIYRPNFLAVFVLLIFLTQIIIYSFIKDYREKDENDIEVHQNLNRLLYMILKISFFTLYWSLLFLFIFSSTFQAVGSTNDMLFLHNQGKLFWVNDHYMNLICYGTPSVNNTVVLFEHGWQGSSLDFSHIQPNLFNKTISCSYDRSGYGFSDIGKFPRTSLQIAQELNELLKVANIDNDLILVGHSFAGYNMRVFRSLNRTRIKGLLF